MPYLHVRGPSSFLLSIFSRSRVFCSSYCILSPVFFCLCKLRRPPSNPLQIIMWTAVRCRMPHILNLTPTDKQNWRLVSWAVLQHNMANIVESWVFNKKNCLNNFRQILHEIHHRCDFLRCFVGVVANTTRRTLLWRQLGGASRSDIHFNGSSLCSW